MTRHDGWSGKWLASITVPSMEKDTPPTSDLAALYRMRAAETLAQAKLVTTPDFRIRLEKIAADWLRMAEKAEREPLLRQEPSE